jgi:hypothetical protein
MHRELATSELESFPSLDWSDIAPRLTTPVRSSLRREPKYKFHECLFCGMQILRLQPRPARSRLILPQP